MKFKNIRPHVRAYAQRLEQETGCKVSFQRMSGSRQRLGISAYLHATANPRQATVYYDLKMQDRTNIQMALVHEMGHAFLWFRDGFYKMFINSSVPPRMMELGAQCFDLVTDVAVDRLMQRDGFNSWTSDLIERMQETINLSLKAINRDGLKSWFYIPNSWDVTCEILNRRLALEYMTISAEQIPVFEQYLQVCQFYLPTSIMDGVEKRFKIIHEHDIFTPGGNRAAIEGLLDLFGIRDNFVFCTIDEDAYGVREMKKGFK